MSDAPAPPETTSPEMPSSPRPPRRLRTGLVVSLVLHGCLLAILVVAPIRMYYANPAGNASPPGGSSGSEGSPEVGNHAANAIAKPASPRTPEEVSKELVQVKVDQLLTQTQKLSEEEKLEKLEGLSKQLDKVSSEKTIEELGGKFNEWLGTTKRAQQPATEKVAGAFDFGTAQLHEVKRERAPEGGWRYRSVLLDAEGRTVEVEMDASQGESSYRTMQLLKANPLADRLYRQITMPLLDKLARTAEEAARVNAQLNDDKTPAAVEVPANGDTGPASKP